ncbi:hypothetical protein ACFL2H_13985, partial [Planctomycetota bacterium]
MHELQRRQLVRITFLLACVAPTVAIVGFAAWMRFPTYAARYSQAIGQATGTSVHIDRVTHPKPHVTRLENLQVFALESHNLLMQAKRLDVLHTNRGFEIEGNLELHADGVTLWNTVQHHLQPNNLPPSVDRFTIRCGELQWRNDATSQTFRDVKCDIKTATESDSHPATADGTTMVLSYRDADKKEGDGDAGAIVLKRTVTGGQVRTTLVARTAKIAIKPALLFPSWYPYCGDSFVRGELGKICFGERVAHVFQACG